MQTKSEYLRDSKIESMRKAMFQEKIAYYSKVKQQIAKAMKKLNNDPPEKSRNRYEPN